MRSTRMLDDTEAINWQLVKLRWLVMLKCHPAGGAGAQYLPSSWRGSLVIFTAQCICLNK